MPAGRRASCRCVRARVRACVCACVRACVRACVGRQSRAAGGNNSLKGTVRYVGPTSFSTDPSFTWVGVELDEPLGTHNGTVESDEYGVMLLICI